MMSPARNPISWLVLVASTDLAGYLDWPGAADWRYLLETGTDLIEWNEAASPLEGSDGPMSWSAPRDAPKRFYRLFGAAVSSDP